MPVIAIAGEKHVPISNVGGDTKTVVESKALLNRVENTNNDANGADMNKVAVTGGSKRGVGVWPVLIVVIISRESTEVAEFIIVLTVDISPVSFGVVGVA